MNVSCYRLCKSVGETSHWQNLYSKGNRLLLVLAEELYGDALPQSEFLPHLLLESGIVKVKRCIEESSSAPHLTAKKESNVTGNVSRSHCSRRLNFTLTPSTETNVISLLFSNDYSISKGFSLFIERSMKNLPYTCCTVHPSSENVLLMCYFLCIVCCGNPANRAFLSGKSFTTCVVIHVSSISHCWFVFTSREKRGRKQTNDAKYQRRERLHLC